MTKFPPPMQYIFNIIFLKAAKDVGAVIPSENIKLALQPEIVIGEAFELVIRKCTTSPAGTEV